MIPGADQNDELLPQYHLCDNIISCSLWVSSFEGWVDDFQFGNLDEIKEYEVSKMPRIL